MTDFHSSPAQRPQLAQQHTSSTQSLSRASPSGPALLSTSHKGPAHKSHKTHAIGHGRHSHGRLTSYGKNMNRLAKNTVAQFEEAEGHTRHHKGTKSHTPSTSPTSQNLKRNTSNVNLPRTGSKVNVKKNSSGISMQQRNGSAAKLGKLARSDKVERRSPKTQPKFSIGSDDQEDEWTEESRSQSPEVLRQVPIVRKPSQPTGPPSPDDPPVQSPSKLPQSPPQSPPQTEASHNSQISQQQPHTRHTRPPHAEAVTSRLLSRHNAAPQVTSFSAAVTPLGSGSSSAFQHQHSNATTLVNTNPSLGADGVSRFLHQNDSSGSATSGSVNQLQSALASFHREQNFKNSRSSHSPSSNSPPSKNLHAAQRAHTASHLAYPHLGTSVSRSPSPPSSKLDGNHSRASPFESPRAAAGRKPKEASKSLTQLKLDLQRIASEHEAERKKGPPAPLLQTSHSTLSVGAGVANSAEGEQERRERQYLQAGKELANAARFEDIFKKALARLENRGSLQKHKVSEDGRRDRTRSATGSLGRSSHDERAAQPANSRGRVRFEIGRAEREEERDGEQHGDGDGERLRGLLRRMWDGDSGAVAGGGDY
ncbi:MAG: hypothetical protein HETSPECPRED_007111 [Heterodermia speciosa]|uniref:Uncharacterized protein n=1 Tax=Heterodermia speciosa TaxID=116794 RepID=A0A8H3EIV2_9LECA|nr:MAG: hypothetical protein HETSPECPRED_007111 [Heterodermia speciosa]